jgi:hypothetical protein
MRPATPIAVLLAIATVVSGCASSRRVETPELSRLHGFRAGDLVGLPTTGGESVVFSKDTPISLVLAGGKEVRQRFDRVEILDGVFYGSVEGTEAQVAVDIGEIAYARIWPPGEMDTPTFAVMVLTMWLLIGVAGLIVYLIWRWADDGDWDVIVVYG